MKFITIQDDEGDDELINLDQVAEIYLVERDSEYKKPFGICFLTCAYEGCNKVYVYYETEEKRNIYFSDLRAMITALQKN